MDASFQWNIQLFDDIPSLKQKKKSETKFYLKESSKVNKNVFYNLLRTIYYILLLQRKQEIAYNLRAIFMGQVGESNYGSTMPATSSVCET